MLMWTEAQMTCGRNFSESPNALWYKLIAPSRIVRAFRNDNKPDCEVAAWKAVLYELHPPRTFSGPSQARFRM